jgi:hypothetical protein
MRRTPDASPSTGEPALDPGLGREAPAADEPVVDHQARRRQQVIRHDVVEVGQSGITLKPGHLLSLGAFSPGPVQGQRTVTVTDEGLPDNPSVRVSFR